MSILRLKLLIISRPPTHLTSPRKSKNQIQNCKYSFLLNSVTLSLLHTSVIQIYFPHLNFPSFSIIFPPSPSSIHIFTLLHIVLKILFLSSKSATALRRKFWAATLKFINTLIESNTSPSFKILQALAQVIETHNLHHQEITLKL